MNAKQRDRLDVLLSQRLATARAYRWALKFDHFYELEADAAEEYLRRWVKGAKRTTLEPLVHFAEIVEEYWLGICRWHHSKVSNGLLEGLNSLIQAAERRARGYRSTRNCEAMIYLVASKLNPPAPTHLK